MIAHVVLFEPKGSTTTADRDSFLDLMRVTLQEIETVRRSFVGIRRKVGATYETKIGDYTYSYASVVEFDDEAALRSYLDHPLHVKVGQLFWQYCERTVILDVDCFWVNDKKVVNN
jgi:hypothetical protein